LAKEGSYIGNGYHRTEYSEVTVYALVTRIKVQRIANDAERISLAASHQ
jgi:hypothetical protein